MIGASTLRDVTAAAKLAMDAPGGLERRRRPRAALHWTLSLRRGGATEPLRTQATNISRDGFYCRLNQPLSPGEKIECDIIVPTHDGHHAGEVVYLRCLARVVRVEQIAAGEIFGVACRVDTYSLVHSRPAGAWPQSAEETFENRI